MKNKIMISVVMATYNCEKYLPKAIESILKQTVKDFEFIIINDGSKDNSSKIITKYAKSDSRIVLIENKVNLGLIKSLNLGLEKAKGKYVARMDSDDVSLPKRFEKQLSYMNNHPETYLIGSSATVIDEHGEEIGAIKINEKDSPEDVLIHPTIFFRRGSIRYRKQALYCEDIDFYLQHLKKGMKLGLFNETVIKYRVTKDSISSKKAFYQKKIQKKITNCYRNLNNHNFDLEYDLNKILKMNIPFYAKDFYKYRYLKFLYLFSNYKTLRKEIKRLSTVEGFKLIFSFYLLAGYCKRITSKNHAGGFF